MSAWALRVAAVVATALVFAGSTRFVVAHGKNPNAPLQPHVADAVADDAVTAAPAATTTPLPQLVPNRGGRPRPTTSPGVTLQPAVRQTALPSVTITHVS